MASRSRSSSSNTLRRVGSKGGVDRGARSGTIPSEIWPAWLLYEIRVLIRVIKPMSLTMLLHDQHFQDEQEENLQVSVILLAQHPRHTHQATSSQIRLQVLEKDLGLV